MNGRLLIAGLAVLALAGTAGAGTIEFEGEAPSGGVLPIPSPYIHDGFRFTRNGGVLYFVDSAYNGGSPPYSNNGTDYLWALSTYTMVFERTDLSAFSFDSFDMVEWWYRVAGSTQIRVHGIQSGGGTVTEFFTTPSRAANPNMQFSTYALTDPGWASVVQVQISGVTTNRWISYDNFVYDTRTSVVPLPAAAWLGLGLLGALGAVRRLRRRSA